MVQFLFFLILFFIIAEYIFSKVLDYLNQKKWTEALPPEAVDFYDQKKYTEARSYHREQSKISLISGLLSTSISLILLIAGGYEILDQFVRSVTTSPILMALLFFGILTFATSLISLPFTIYSTFVIEEKYGFNKMTWKIFILDLLKGLLLSAILGGGILSLIIFVYMKMPDHFWWIAWLIVSALTIFFAMFYTSLIVPLFNKLTPLEEGDLKKEISDYAQKVNFPLTEIFVIDGSKRSTKANAYFSGLGPKKTIVLFDTLIKEQTKEELTAVLAHEVGHFKEKHVLKSLAISLIQIAILFLVFGKVCSSPLLHQALGVSEGSFHIALIGFSLLYSPISIFTGIAMNALSRKNEFEADAFAKKTYGGSDLISALKKLTISNLSNLTPHPWYVFVHYSHPPVLERIKMLK